jgi:transcriptional regulator with XRE-family HTH domain
MAETTSDQGPHFVDKHVGERLRRRRKDLNLSQEELANSVGLTFQQIQKYERGSNRVSASKLYQMAQTLQASVGYFFEGLANPVRGVSEGEDAQFDHEMPLTPEQRELVNLFDRIDSRKIRKVVLNLVRTIHEESGGKPMERDEEADDAGAEPRSTPEA